MKVIRTSRLDCFWKIDLKVLPHEAPYYQFFATLFSTYQSNEITHDCHLSFYPNFHSKDCLETLNEVLFALPYVALTSFPSYSNSFSREEETSKQSFDIMSTSTRLPVSVEFNQAVMRGHPNKDQRSRGELSSTCDNQYMIQSSETSSYSKQASLLENMNRDQIRDCSDKYDFQIQSDLLSPLQPQPAPMTDPTMNNHMNTWHDCGQSAQTRLVQSPLSCDQHAIDSTSKREVHLNEGILKQVTPVLSYPTISEYRFARFSDLLKQNNTKRAVNVDYYHIDFILTSPQGWEAHPTPWSGIEIFEGRKIVQVRRSQKGICLHAQFNTLLDGNAISKIELDSDFIDVCCLRVIDRSMKEQFFVTSIDVLKIVNFLIGSEQSDIGFRRMERARIRSNLSRFWERNEAIQRYGFQVMNDSRLTTKKNNVINDFPNQVNFLGGVRLMPWSRLASAIRQALLYYRAIPQDFKIPQSIS